MDLSVLKEYFSILSILIIIGLIILSMYNKIKYECLKKACEQIAKAESYTNLSGQEKFKLVVEWISNSLPKIFATSLFKTLIETLIQYAYDNSFDYMKKYIKNKTGLDVDTVIKEIRNSSSDDSE